MHFLNFLAYPTFNETKKFENNQSFVLEIPKLPPEKNILSIFLYF